MKFFLLVLSFFTTAYCGVTSVGEWQIYTPQNTLRTFINSDHSGSYEQLKKLGEQAHEIWQANSDKVLVDDLRKNFNEVTPAFMVDVIEEILNNDDLLAQVTAASYRNATGFLKIVLVANGAKSWKLRLHVWKQGEKEYPHNHKWDFYSKILAGYLEQTLYRVSASEFSDAVLCNICEPVSLMPLLPNGEAPCPCRDKYALTAKQKEQDQFSSVYLGKYNRMIIGTGESYFMPNHLVHTIAPGKQAITFVFTSEQVNDNSEVFVPKEVDASLQKHAPSVTRQELCQELQNIKKILQGLPVSAKYLPEMVDLEHCYYDKNDPIFSTPNWRSNFLTKSAATSLVKQLTVLEQAKYMVSVSGQGDILVGNQKLSSNQELLFVLFDGVMYAAPKDFAHHAKSLICHTSFTDYAPVTAAGVLHFDENCKLAKIEAYSGHYAPALVDMQFALNHLTALGYDTASVLITGYIDRI